MKYFLLQSSCHVKWYSTFFKSDQNLFENNVSCLVAQSCPTFCNLMDCSPWDSFVHGDSPGKNTGVGCHTLFQGIFPTQESNPDLLHCRQSFYQLSYQGSPMIMLSPTQIPLLSTHRSYTHTHTHTLTLQIEMLLYCLWNKSKFLEKAFKDFNSFWLAFLIKYFTLNWYS